MKIKIQGTVGQTVSTNGTPVNLTVEVSTKALLMLLLGLRVPGNDPERLAKKVDAAE